MRAMCLFLILGLSLVITACSKPATIKVVFEPSTVDKELVAQIDQGVVSNIVLRLNKALKLPSDLTIVFKDSADGPHYQGDTIVMSYSILSEVSKSLESYDDEISSEQRKKIIIANVYFVLFHELGHAIVNLCDIPVVGNEEDAVDGLATVVSVGLLNMPEIALAAAVSLDAAEDDEATLSEDAYWGKHSLNSQRYYNILCWVHGGTGERFTEILGSLAPTDWFETRAKDCPEEYERLALNWEELLRPHLKPGARFKTRQ